MITLSPEALEGLIERAVEHALSRHSAVNEPMLTVRQVAQHLNVSEKTVSRRIEDGTLPSTKVGRSRRIPAAALRPPNESEVSVLALRARDA